MRPDAGDRHLSPGALLEHWATAVPVVIPIAGEPALLLRIDAPRSRLTLRTPIPPDTDVGISPRRHIKLDVLVDGDSRFLEISTTDERLVVDGYAMLCAVADRIQLDGLPPMTALEQTLETWQSILAMRVRMSPQAEIGLFGELLVLEAVVSAGSQLSLGSWRGALSEEHDFGFPDADVEVKTTTGERRQHWIHGLGQLTATSETPLWMLSIQITRGGTGQGRSLPELIADVLAMALDADRARLSQNLGAAGWHDGQEDLFSERWRLRAPPVPLCVDDSFPRLTAVALSSAGVDVAALRQLSYEIDVTDRPAAVDCPASLDAIVQRMGGITDD